MKTFPENPDLNTTLGLLQIQLGNHRAAFECLGTALAFDPNNSKAILAAGSLAMGVALQAGKKVVARP